MRANSSSRGGLAAVAIPGSIRTSRLDCLAEFTPDRDPGPAMTEGAPAAPRS
jgi:hypothetical protein